MGKQEAEKPAEQVVEANETRGTLTEEVPLTPVQA